MSTEGNKMEEVELEIEETWIKCNKKDLIDHSEYFRVMFKNDSRDNYKKAVKLGNLQGVSLKSMNIILLLLKDPFENIALLRGKDDLMSVLETSCILQFHEITYMCVRRLINTLSPDNCIRMWLLAEKLVLKDLYLRAKGMALLEFNFLDDSDMLMDFDLERLCKYLGNISLQCDCELDVFQVCMKWWSINSKQLLSNINNGHLDSFQTELFMKLLSCIDFKKLRNSDIQKMITHSNLSRNAGINEILKYMMNNVKLCDYCSPNKIYIMLKNISYNENIVNKAKALCRCKPRRCKQYIYLCTITSTVKKLGTSVCYDAFRKKEYVKLKKKFNNDVTPTIIQYDGNKNIFRKLVSLEKQKGKQHYYVLSYKEFIVLLSGERTKRLGDYATCLWVYNTITDRWQHKSVLPYRQKSIQPCIAESTLYIVGYGVLFWYDLKRNEWSETISLPCPSMKMVCSSWNDKLVIVVGWERHVYIFDKHKEMWFRMFIFDHNKLIKRFPNEFAVFSYEDSLYIKGNSLIEMKILGDKLTVVKCTGMTSIKCKEIKSVVIDNVVYTLYNLGPKKGFVATALEKYCMETGKVEFIFRSRGKGIPISIEGVNNATCRITNVLCGLQHYELLASDDFVNEMCKIDLLRKAKA